MKLVSVDRPGRRELAVSGSRERENGDSGRLNLLCVRCSNGKRHCRRSPFAVRRSPCVVRRSPFAVGLALYATALAAL